jgi:hypothetical protein
MISMKLVITFFSCCVSKELKLAKFALSLPSIMVALFLKLSMIIEKKRDMLHRVMHFDCRS